MRVFLTLFVVLAFVGCGADNPTKPGPVGTLPRVPLESPDEPGGDTAADAELQLPATGFENPLSTFDFNAISGEQDLEPSDVLDPEGTEPPPDDTDTGDGDGPDDDLEPEVIPADEPDSGDELDPEVTGGDDPDDSPDDVDAFGIQVIE